MFRTRSVILALAAVAVFASAPAMAQDHAFRAFITANWVSPNGSDDITVGSITDAVQGSDDWGYEAGFEWRASRIIGLEGSFMAGSNDFEFGNTDIGTLDTQAFTAGVNFHIVPFKYFDLWVAPVASWYSYGDVEVPSTGGGGGGNVDLGTSWGYGAQVGFDIGIGKTFAITGGVRYIKVDIEGDDLSDNVSFDPVIARAGIAFRWGTRH